ncbi:MAG: hypothetical protein IKA71_00620 [Lentisphaeria bacterium]|nr:hypothetical protein [Lentisphaeria bacterium]
MKIKSLLTLFVFALTAILNAQILNPVDAQLISCAAGNSAAGKITQVVPLQAGSIFWKMPGTSLEQFDRVEFELTGVTGKFVPNSFSFAFRADGQYHFAPYAQKPVISSGNVKLVFNISKVYRKNVVAIRLFINRNSVKQNAFDFTVKKANFFNAQKQSDAEPLLDISKATLISCKDIKPGVNISNGKIITTPLDSGAVMIPLRKVPEGYGIVKVTVTAAPGTFTPGAFSLSLRAPGNKYDFCRSAAKPVFNGDKITLRFDITKLTHRGHNLLRLYFNRNKQIKNEIKFQLDNIEFEKKKLTDVPQKYKTISKLPFCKHNRKFDKTLIIPRTQIKYSLFLNYHAPGTRDIWLDRPLEVDRNLTGKLRSYDKSGNARSLQKDAAALLSYADAMGILATSQSYLDRTLRGMEYADQAGLKNYWLLEISPALTDLSDMSGDGEFGFIADILKHALKSPSAFRYNGKVVISSYNANAIAPEKWIPILQELRRISNNQVLFVAEIRPLFYQAAGEYNRNGGFISEQTHEAMKDFIRSYLNVADGVSFAGCNHLAAKTEDMSTTRFAHKFYEDILLPTLVSVCNEPAYRNKLLGVSAAKGYFSRKNATSGQNEEGTLTLRRSMTAALAIEPDFILMPEWNEANENTHIQPTVYDSYASRRVINHFRGKTESMPDNTALPNLIASYRREIVRGEILTVEILNIPDRRFKAGTITVRLKFKDANGNVIMDFGDDTLDSTALCEKRYNVPAEKFISHRLIVPELTWTAAGKGGKFDGLAAILLETPPTMNKKYVKHPLRDMIPMDNINLNWSVDDSTVKVSGEMSTKCNFNSIELLENTFPVDALDVHNEYNDADGRQTISLIWNSITEGEALLNIKNIKGQSDSMDDKSIHMAEFTRSAVRKNHGIITKKLNFIPHQNMFNFKTTADAVLEISLDDQKFTVSIADILKNGVFRKVFPDSKTIQLEPKKRNFTLPYPIGSAKAKFNLSALRLDPAAVYSVRAITEDGKIFNSAPFYPQRLSGKKVQTNVWSFSELKPVAVQLPEEFTRTVDYDFTPAAGDMLLTGNRFYHAFSGGGNHALHLLRKSASASAPEKIRHQGADVLRFDGKNNVITVPKLLVSEQTLRIKFTIMPENDRAQVILDGGYTFDRSLWCHLKEGRLYGGFRNRQNKIAEFSTAPVVKTGEWNDIEIRYDLHDLSIICNGKTAAKVKCSGLMYKQSDIFFGGMDQIKLPLPRFKGLLKNLTVSNCL